MARRRRPSVDPERRAARRRSIRDDVWNIPNLITMGRVALIPVVLYFLDRGTPRDCLHATLVYSFAALSDLLDGYLARRLNVVSVLGKFLDPLADKLLVMASLVWMVPLGRIPPWAVVVLLAREISITALRSIASSEGVIIAATDEAKVKTALQMVAILCLLLGYPYHLSVGSWDLGLVDLVNVGRVMLYISLVYSLASAVNYFALFAEAVEAKDRKKTSE
jgi:CDP-diacylglycerol--glycerol-3-phosphate 3-phosphatidyltransferase